jgi:putative glutamate/gamma-aminobutyrate antiporter
MQRRIISVFMLAMINVAAILNITNLPVTAQQGFSLLFYYAFAGLGFFLPAALISAELATTWPEKGGVYVWVKEALGTKWGFLAIWLQWLENTVWLPTTLSFIAATLSYIIYPPLMQSKIYFLCIILGIFWPVTLLNFFGMRISGWISTLCVIIGTMIPAFIIIVLGLIWYFGGHPLQIETSWHSLLPSFSSFQPFSILAAVLLGFCGIEMSAVHTEEVQNPQKSYVKAISLSAIIIVSFASLGALSIAFVVPSSSIELTSGTIEGFKQFFAAYHMSWALPIVGGLMLIGCLGLMSTWIAGPVKGLVVTAEDGNLPPLLQKRNSYNMPVALLLLQACIISGLAFVIFYFPSISSSYFLFLQLASMLYLIMYVLMFISAIILRYKRSEIKRVFKIPFGKIGLWGFSLLGIVSSVFAFILGFIPPDNLTKEKAHFYSIFLIISIIVCSAVPFILYRFKKDHWISKNSSKE